MIVKIAITIFFVLLVIPIEYIIFPKLDRQEGRDRVITDNVSSNGIWLVVIIVISIVISFGALFVNDREIWYLYLIPMVWPIFLRFIMAFTNLQKRLLPIVLPILVIALIGCSILPIRDFVLGYEPEVSSSYVKDWEEPILSEAQIKARLSASTISAPSYDIDEGRYIYEINQGKIGYGVALVDAKSIEFLPCKYENQVSGIVREHYPKEEIVQLGIEIRGAVPYAKFGILKRPHMFSKPEIDFYVLLDMQKGKMKEE